MLYITVYTKISNLKMFQNLSNGQNIRMFTNNQSELLLAILIALFMCEFK